MLKLRCTSQLFTLRLSSALSSAFSHQIILFHTRRRDLSTASHDCDSKSSKTNNYDVVIVGGGIVGLATARHIALRTKGQLRMLLLEKESELSTHQSGHNSGVIHAGIYYTPGSLKARLCVEGMRATYQYCDSHGIPYRKAGKLIVAVEQHELPKLDELRIRGEKNEVPELRMLTSAKEIAEVEPNCRGLRALHSPHTGIVDFRRMALSFGQDFQSAGGIIRCQTEVCDFRESPDHPEHPVSLVLANSQEVVNARYVITCCGLHSDRIAERSGCSREPRIVPFRGDYLLVRPDRRDIVNTNIYPVPDPRFPFLGVHFTPRMNGDIWLGPNAVWSLKREGYGRFDFNLRDFVDALTYPGLLRIGWRYLGVGLRELQGVVSMASTVAKLQRYVPSLKLEDVMRGPAGVRAQALDVQGNLVDDFIFDSGKGPIASRIVHVRNAPSPAATSSLAIGRVVSEKATELFKI